MDKKMFCYQCEQTVGCTGCTGNAGVCGKKAGTAKLQDELTGALIGLARAVDSAAAISKSTSQVIIEGLFTTVTNVSFDDAAIENMIQKVRAEKERLVPGCSKCQSPCGKSDEYDMQQLWNADEDIRSLKSLILFGIRGMAAYAYHANVLNYEDAEVNRFFCEALFKIGYEESMDTLLPTVLKVGEINLKCMALLDKANTKTYGTPEPTAVTLTVEKGPFIVVTGHDLKDLQLLLEQTEGKGINIYTHGEMLPAHAYPLLKKFSHLKGNFGTAWQNQQKEFDHLPACGKFRFNDLDLGEIGGLPRLMDMGQCNDAYGAIQVAVALADAFGCSVNELPLSFVLSWYEQKAVCILLTLLHLGIKNIRLGPSLPAFLSPNILNYLVENYGIAPITTPEEDIKALMNQ